MRIGPYIMAAMCAVLFSSGLTGPVWLCVRADGLVSLKANAAASCESACSAEPDHHDEKVPAAVSAPERCCLDIPIGLDGKPLPTKPTRPRKAGSSPAPAQAGGLCPRSVPAGAELGLLTPSQPAGSSGLSFLIRTVVLLI